MSWSSEGAALLETTLPRGHVGRYQLQAAIAAVHAEAATYEDTDWRQILVLYGMLQAVAPGWAVTLNHAVAAAMVHGPETGLAMLEPLGADPAMRRHHRLYAVRAHLRELAGDQDAAAEDYQRAAQLTASLPEQRYLNRRLTRLAARPNAIPHNPDLEQLTLDRETETAMSSTIFPLDNTLARRVHQPGTPGFDAARDGFDLSAIPTPDVAVSIDRRGRRPGRGAGRGRPRDARRRPGDRSRADPRRRPRPAP